eukprot:1786868-Pyramimonas_sp.AAC.1
MDTFWVPDQASRRAEPVRARKQRIFRAQLKGVCWFVACLVQQLSVAAAQARAEAAMGELEAAFEREEQVYSFSPSAIGARYEYIPSPLLRLVPAMSTFLLPFCDWCPLRAYSLSPSGQKGGDLSSLQAGPRPVRGPLHRQPGRPVSGADPPERVKTARRGRCVAVMVGIMM